MKVVAFAGNNNVIVGMTKDELYMLAGFNNDRDFDQAVGCTTRNEPSHVISQSLTKVENIPVGEIYKEAKDTLSAYEELRTKFESIRNQLTTLLKRMVSLSPAPKEK